MTQITVRTLIDAPVERVWADVRDLASHVEWMDDAVAIRFASPLREGVGTTFDCDTRIGPLRLTDRMEVTEWEDGQTIGIRHVGVVRGAGRFTLRPAPGGQTCFTWKEQLTFPWWMGGRVGSAVGARMLKAVWRTNLAHLRVRFEPGGGG